MLVPRLPLVRFVHRVCAAYAFVEDCPCGCQSYFVFGRNRTTDEVVLAFGEQRDAERFEFVSLGPATGLAAVHAATADPHTWWIVGRVIEVLLTSDGCTEIEAKVVRLRAKKRETQESSEPQQEVPGGTMSIAMNEADYAQLDRVLDRYLGVSKSGLTASELGELRRMIRGFACKEAASDAGISAETIRARRKRIYRKVAVEGVHDMLAQILFVSLQMLGEKEPAKPSSPFTAAVAGTPAAS